MNMVSTAELLRNNHQDRYVGYIPQDDRAHIHVETTVAGEPQKDGTPTTKVETSTMDVPASLISAAQERRTWALGNGKNPNNMDKLISSDGKYMVFQVEGIPIYDVYDISSTHKSGNYRQLVQDLRTEQANRTNVDKMGAQASMMKKMAGQPFMPQTQNPLPGTNPTGEFQNPSF